MHTLPVLAVLLSTLAPQQPSPTPSPTPTPAPAAAKPFYRVRVVDDRGQPAAGIPLVLGQDRGDLFGFEAIAGVPAVTTDADGFATFVVDAHLPATNLFAEAKVLAEPPVRTGLVAPGIVSHVTMQLPPTGQVRVLCYDLAEQPLAGVTSVGLQIAGNRRFFDRVEPAGTLQPEGALFPRVALGHRLVATAALRGTHGVLRTEHAGPTRRGELVVVDLRLQAAQLLTARIVGLDGRPAANATLGGFLVNFESAWTVGLSTDPDGVLRYFVPPHGVGALDSALVVVRRSGGRDAPTEYLGGARIPTDQPWHGERALGDVVLQAETPIVQGRLLDPDDKPMPDVVLTAPMSFLAGARKGVADDGEREHRVRTDAEGRFVFREFSPRPARLEVKAEGGIALPAPTLVAVGDGEAVLRGGRLGSVFVGMPGLPAGLRVEYLALRPAVPAQGPGQFGEFPPSLVSVPDGVAFPDVPPGRYHLFVGAKKHPTDAFEVPAGRRGEDPRLVLTDWREYLRLVRYTVEGPAPLQAKAQVLVAGRFPGGHSVHGFGYVADAPRDLLIPRGSTLSIQGPNCCTFVADDTSPVYRIVLQPRPQVRLSLPDGITLPKDLRLVLVADDRPWLDAAVHVRTAGERSWDLRPDGAGRFTATLSAPSGDGEYDELWRGEVAVPDGPGPHPVALPIDAAVVQQLRERSAARRK